MTVILWYLGIASRFALIHLLIWRGLLKQQAALIAFLWISFAKSILLWLIGLSGAVAYRDWYMRIEPVAGPALDAILVYGGIEQILRHYPDDPRMRRVGQYTTIIFMVLSVLVVLGTADTFAPYRAGLLYSTVLSIRHYSVACLLVLALTWGFYSRGVRLDGNTRLYLWGACALLAIEAVGAGMARYRCFGGQQVALLAPMVACGFWGRMKG